MRTNLLAATAIALVALAGGASAQTTGTTGTASASNSVTVNAVTGMGMGNGSGADGASGSGGNLPTTNIHYSGHEYSTPSVQGSYFAGANPCLIGVGGSGAGGPIGLSFTFGSNDRGCQRRSDAAAWHALGHDDVAISRMCQDDENRHAFEAIGYTCPQDRAKAPLAAAAAPAMVLAAATPPAPLPVAKPQRFVQPEWCGSVTGSAERSRYQQACEF